MCIQSGGKQLQVKRMALVRSIPLYNLTCSNMYSAILEHSHSTNIQMLTYKFLYRWHMTPQWLHKINPAISNMCWRGCKATGSFTHCWWHCPKSQTFLREVESQISLITGLALPFQPVLFLRNLWLDKAPDPLTKDLIEHLQQDMSLHSTGCRGPP